MPRTLEDYLDQLRFQLKALPEKKRESEIQEVRQHIESLIADYRQSGDSEEIATMKSLRQFGSARRNGYSLRRTWQREISRQRRSWTAVAGIFMAMACLLVAFVIGNTTRMSSSLVASPAQNLSPIVIIDREHEAETQAIQQRWETDNLAIQRMPPGDSEAVSNARSEAMTRYQITMNASNARWSARVKAWQHQQFVLWVVMPLVGVGMFFMMGLLLLVRNKPFNRPRPTSVA